MQQEIGSPLEKEILNNIVNKIDILKIDSFGNEEKILNSLNDNYLQVIFSISIKWYNFSELENKNEIVDSYLKKGFSCWVNLESNFARLFFYKK